MTVIAGVVHQGRVWMGGDSAGVRGPFVVLSTGAR